MSGTDRKSFQVMVGYICLCASCLPASLLYCGFAGIAGAVSGWRNSSSQEHTLIDRRGQEAPDTLADTLLIPPQTIGKETWKKEPRPILRGDLHRIPMNSLLLLEGLKAYVARLTEPGRELEMRTILKLGNGLGGSNGSFLGYINSVYLIPRGDASIYKRLVQMLTRSLFSVLPQGQGQ